MSEQLVSCNQALEVYRALGIRKERIDKGQAWENYIETMLYVMWNLENSQITCIMWTTSTFLLKSFQETVRVFHIINVVRRMADFHFHQAASWEEMLAVHRKWMQDSNAQRHWAHRERQDGCLSPAQVLGWHKGTMYPEAVLNRILFATRSTRYLDQHGYVRFHHWRLSGERGLASRPVTIWVYDGTLKVEYQAVVLSQYTVELQEDRKHLRQVSHPRLADTLFRSPQWTLFDLGPDDWLLSLRLPAYAPRQRVRKVQGLVQLLLFEERPADPAVPADPPRPQLRLLPLQEPEEVQP